MRTADLLVLQILRSCDHTELHTGRFTYCDLRGGPFRAAQPGNQPLRPSRMKRPPDSIAVLYLREHPVLLPCMVRTAGGLESATLSAASPVACPATALA